VSTVGTRKPGTGADRTRGASQASGASQARGADEDHGRAEAHGRAEGLATGWTVTSYLLAGMAAYGGIGWLIGRATGIALLFPIGMMAGLAVAVSYIIYRYGRPAAGTAGRERGRDKDMETGVSAAASPRPSRLRGKPRKENR
jgi:hypothetical protein